MDTDQTLERERLLLHACCAPCSSHCVEAARRLGYAPTLFFANDNLAHEGEFARRLESMEILAARLDVPLAVADYDHSAWLEAVAGLEAEPEGGRRCEACFRHNLARTAVQAAEQGFGGFTSTLTVSPHKRSAAVFEAGHAVEVEGGPRFVACDFKKGGGFLRSVELARAFGLYRQTYCGCEFSERSAKRKD